MKTTYYARFKKGRPYAQRAKQAKDDRRQKICYRNTLGKKLCAVGTAPPLRQKSPYRDKQPVPALSSALRGTAGCPYNGSADRAQLAAIPQHFCERREVIRAHTIKNTTSIEVVFLLFFFPPYIQIANRRRIGSNTRRRRLRCFHSSSVTRWLCSTI